MPLRSFSTIFYPIFVFAHQPTGVGSDYRSSCACQEKGADEFGDGGFAYRLNPFFLCCLLLLPQGVCLWARRALQRFLPYKKVFNSWLTCALWEFCPSASAVRVEQAMLTSLWSHCSVWLWGAKVGWPRLWVCVSPQGGPEHWERSCFSHLSPICWVALSPNGCWVLEEFFLSI